MLRSAGSLLRRKSLRLASNFHKKGQATAARATPDMSAAGDQAIQEFRRFIPALEAGGSNYKGQHGKVGVVGGCRDYTGAPYFAAASAAKAGADLAYVFCSESAAPVIKGYSPEIIVLTTLPEVPAFREAPEPPYPEAPHAVKLAVRWVERLSCLIVGPGLGDDPISNAVAKEIIEFARKMDLPLIVDGSGINIIAAHPELVQGYPNCLLTPNISELGRIAKAFKVPLEGPMGSGWQEYSKPIARALAGPVLLSKGPVDFITDGETMLECDLGASPKRCGGQGDILTGLAGTYISWAVAGKGASTHPASRDVTRGIMVAALAACQILRGASLKAFEKTGRGMAAADIIPEIPSVAKSMLGN